MKKNLVFTGIIISAIILGALNFAEKDTAEEEIEQLVGSAYVHVAYNELNPEAMTNGFILFTKINSSPFDAKTSCTHLKIVDFAYYNES